MTKRRQYQRWCHQSHHPPFREPQAPDITGTSPVRMLKDPMFVDALYLHTPRRIEALSYVLVMACLIYSIFERRVRRSLAERQCY